MAKELEAIAGVRQDHQDGYLCQHRHGHAGMFKVETLGSSLTLVGRPQPFDLLDFKKVSSRIWFIAC